MRGLAIVVMAARHADLPVRDLCWRSLGYASFGQVFVLLSGIVTALVWLRLRAAQGDGALRRVAWRRAATLWAVHVALLLWLAVLVRIGSETGTAWTPRRGRLMLDDPLEAVALGAAFLWQPPFFDILPMYCLFLAATPFVLPRLAAGGRSAAWVLGGSVGLWTAAQAGLLDLVTAPLPDGLPVVLPVFDPFAWQFVFCVGLWLGVRRSRGEALPFPRSRPASIALAALLVAVVAGQYVLSHTKGGERRYETDTAWIFRREGGGPVSLVAFAAMAYGVAWIGALRPSVLDWPAFAYLGRHALSVFAFHLVVVLPTWLLPPLHVAVAWALTPVLLASLWLPAWWGERRRTRRRAAPPDPGPAPRESCAPGAPG